MRSGLPYTGEPRFALRKATVMRTKILSVTPVNPLGVTAPLTSKGSQENGVNAMPCRRYNPSVKPSKAKRLDSSPYTGEPRFALRKATVMQTKILSVTPVNPLGVTAPLMNKGSQENGVNANPCRGYNPSVFLRQKGAKIQLPLHRGAKAAPPLRSRAAHGICKGASRG